MDLADTGSALGLFAALYKYVDQTRRKEYVAAVRRYTDAIQANGLLLPNGAFGSGWSKIKNGKEIDIKAGPHVLTTALTGAIVYTWMYHVTKEDKYRRVAHRALEWIFSHMGRDGNLPYVGNGADWAEHGNFKNSDMMWSKLTYGTAAYVGEGVIAFDLHCGNPAWQDRIQKTVRPNILFLLRNQLPDGTWSGLSRISWDRTRSPGIVNYLIWYYDHVDRDPRIQTAVQRFDAFIVNPKNGYSYGMMIDGATGGGSRDSYNTVTSLTGRALAGILKPGVEAW